MNQKILIIILSAILLALIGGVAYMILFNEPTTTVKLSETCSINVTGKVDTVFENGMNQIKIYDKLNNKEYKSIVVYSGANAGLQEVMTFGMFKSMFVGNAWDTGAEPVQTQWNGETVYVIYTGNNITHDNILIISKNRDDCIKMYKSIKYNTVNTTNNTTSVNTTVEKISTDNNKQANQQTQQKDSQQVQDIKNNPNMPEDRKQIYAARQKAAEDGVPMYEYTQSPELVEKYQAMV